MKRELNRRLFQAVGAEFWPDVKQLLAQGASANARDETSSLSILHASVLSNGSERITRILLENGADTNSRSTGNGFTALHFAAQSGKLAHIRTLVEFNASLSATDNSGNTPLHTAIESGNLFAAAQLVMLGANVDFRNTLGKTPLEMAQNKLSGLKGYKELMTAISHKHSQRIRGIRRNHPRDLLPS